MVLEPCEEMPLLQAASNTALAAAARKPRRVRNCIILPFLDASAGLCGPVAPVYIPHLVAKSRANAMAGRAPADARLAPARASCKAARETAAGGDGWARRRWRW
jgi:hypothetical protein